MTATLFIFSSIVAALLLVLGWALRAPGKSSRGKFDLASLEESGRRHATYVALIEQAASPADMEFLAQARVAGDCPSSTPRAPQGRAPLSGAPS